MAPTDSALAQLQKALGPTYTKLEKFRVGGMARLYRTHDQLLNRDLVIKVLGPVREDAVRAAERLAREAQVVATLSHPNIVPIYFAGEYTDDNADGAQFFFALKFVNGPSLDFVGAIDSVEATRILRDIAWALDHAHACGVYHRDIKPANVCIENPTKRPVLLDFGIAAIFGRKGLTKEGTLLGTMPYMSPEQIVGGDTADPRVDIYALGEVGFRLLTGRDPFLDELTYVRLLDNKRDWSETDLWRAAPAAPQRLVAAISQCLKWDPADRYQSAAALARDLDSMMPKISMRALLSCFASKQIDAEAWAALGLAAGMPEPLSPDPHPFSIYILHNWLAEFGYSTVDQLLSHLIYLQASAPQTLREFVLSCDNDDPPYAFGIEVLRIVLAIEHRATVDFPHLTIPEDRIARQLHRFLKHRTDAPPATRALDPQRQAERT